METPLQETILTQISIHSLKLTPNFRQRLFKGQKCRPTHPLNQGSNTFCKHSVFWTIPKVWNRCWDSHPLHHGGHLGLKQVENHIIHSSKTLMALLSPLIATWHDTAKQDPSSASAFTGKRTRDMGFRLSVLKEFLQMQKWKVCEECQGMG